MFSESSRSKYVVFFKNFSLRHKGRVNQHIPVTLGPCCHPINFSCEKKAEYPEETHDPRGERLVV